MEAKPLAAAGSVARAMSVTWTQVRRRRLDRHWLLRRGGAENVATIAADVCGIHAQVMPAAEISFGVRADVTRAQLRDALWRDKSLVRTYGIRGTIHIFSASDVRLWMAARRARGALDPEWDENRFSSVGISAAQVDQLVAAMDSALQGRALTMKELGEEVVRRTGAWAGESKNDYWGSTGWPNWRIAMTTAAQREVLCFGPPKGQQVTFVRLDDWIGRGDRWDEETALLAAIRRFLHAYGPAPAPAFNQWFYLPARTGRAIAARMRQEFQEISVAGGKPLFTVDTDYDAAPGEATVRLLPHFDCYLRGFYPREELGADHARRAAGGTGQFPVLLVDGQVGGVWERVTRGRTLVVRVDPFVSLNKRQTRQLKAEAERVGRVLDSETRLELGTVEVRAHL